MNIYIPLGIALVLICFFCKNNAKASVRAFIISMIILAVLGSVRYQMGTDYSNYLATFETLGEYGFDNFFYFVASRAEPLFIFIMSLFHSFFLFIIVLTIIWYVLVTYILCKHVPANYLWLALFSLLFIQSNIIQNYAAIRSSVACCFIFVAIEFLLKGKRIVAASFIIAATFCHYSSSLLLALLFFYSLSDSIMLKVLKICAICSIPLFLISPYITDLIGNSIVGHISSFERYEDYIKMYNDRELSIGSLLYSILAFIPAFMMYQTIQGGRGKQYTFIVSVAILALFLYIIMGGLMIRYSMYLGPTIIVAVTNSLNKMNKDKKMLFLTCFIIYNIYDFVVLQSARWFSSFLTYKTIFEAPGWM